MQVKDQKIHTFFGARAGNEHGKGRIPTESTKVVEIERVYNRWG
jgi:hypothetical protein